MTFPGGGTREDAARRDLPELEDQYPEYFMWGVLPGYGLYARHVRGLMLSRVRFELTATDLRPAVVCDDMEDLEIEGLTAAVDARAEAMLRLRSTRGAFLRACRPLGDCPVLLRVEGAASRGILLMDNDLRKARAAVQTAGGADARAVDSTTQRAP